MEIADVATGERKVLHQGGLRPIRPSGHLVYVSKAALVRRAVRSGAARGRRLPGASGAGRLLEPHGRRSVHLLVHRRARCTCGRARGAEVQDSLSGPPRGARKRSRRPRRRRSPPLARRQRLSLSAQGRQLRHLGLRPRTRRPHAVDLRRRPGDRAGVVARRHAASRSARAGPGSRGLYRKRADGSGEEELLLKGRLRLPFAPGP